MRRALKRILFALWVLSYLLLWSRSIGMQVRIDRIEQSAHYAGQLAKDALRLATEVAHRGQSITPAASAPPPAGQRRTTDDRSRN